MSKRTLQAVLFDRKKWDKTLIKNFLKRNNMKPIKPVHVTANYFRYRLVDPKKFKILRTKKFENGVRFILGY